MARTAEPFTHFKVTVLAQFREPWAMDLLPGTPFLAVTEKAGTLKLWAPGKPAIKVAGLPPVTYGGDGGLGDVKAAPDFARSGLIYLSWIEEGKGGTRGAVAGRARLVLDANPRLEGLSVIWRQNPKVSGHGHYSHRLAFAPDGRHLYISSGDRRLMTPAQDRKSGLGKILRLTIGAVPGKAEMVSMGHRNVLGLKFDAQGRLWGLEHGPDGGDELNLIKPGANYGWPVVSEGRHYDGRTIPHHSAHPEFAAPAISWNPVIAPGDFIFYSGAMWPEWKGQAIIAGLKTQSLVRVGIEGETGKELARYRLQNRIRDVIQGPDGALWVIEDGPYGRLLRLSRD